MNSNQKPCNLTWDIKDPKLLNTEVTVIERTACYYSQITVLKFANILGLQVIGQLTLYFTNKRSMGIYKGEEYKTTT